MKVAILGTGNMGAAFAAELAATHEVSIGSRDPAKAAALADTIGVGAVGGGIGAAVKLSDVVILALPFAAVSDALKQAGDLSGKVLIDISNPLTADFQGLSIGHLTSAAEEIQAWAPTAKVVKGFNTIFAQLVAAENRKTKSLQVFIAADDESAKQTAIALASSISFQAVDAGPLKNARFLEPVGAMNIQFGFFLGKGPVVAPVWLGL